MFNKKRLKHKLNATRCEADDRKFPSKLEARYYAHLRRLEKEGIVTMFLEQVPLRVAKDTKYVVDFVVFYADGTVEFEECKGLMTPLASLKIKLAEQKYPIEIKIITDKDF